MRKHVVELVEYVLIVSGLDLSSLASVHCAHGCLRPANVIPRSSLPGAHGRPLLPREL